MPKTSHAAAKGKAEQIEKLAEGLEAHEKEGMQEQRGKKRGKRRKSGRGARR